MDEEQDEECIVSNCLEVKEISIPTESLQPCDPEQRRIHCCVECAADEDVKQFNMLRHKFPIQNYKQNCDTQVVQARVCIHHQLYKADQNYSCVE